MRAKPKSVGAGNPRQYGSSSARPCLRPSSPVRKGGDPAFPRPTSLSHLGKTLTRRKRFARFRPSLQNKAFLKLETSARRSQLERGLGRTFGSSSLHGHLLGSSLPPSSLQMPEIYPVVVVGSTLPRPHAAPCPLSPCVCVRARAPGAAVTTPRPAPGCALERPEASSSPRLCLAARPPPRAPLL